MALSRLHQAFKHLTTTSAAATARLPFSRRRRCGSRARLAAATREYRMVESLESRMLLTTVSGTIDANGQPKDGDIFEYRQSTNGANDIIVRVKLQGRITAELVGAQVSRRNNDIDLVNLPGLLNGQPVFGGITQPPGADIIGGLGIPGFNNANIQALAASGPGSFYALAFQPNATGIDPITQLPVPGSATQIIQLTLPAADPNTGDINGQVTGTIIGSIFTPQGQNNPNVPASITGADLSPTGELFFTGAIANNGVGLFSVTPSVADPNTPVDEVAQSLSFIGTPIPPGGATQPGQAPPSVSSIAFVGGALFGLVNGAGAGAGGGQGQGSQLVGINLATGDIDFANNVTAGANTNIGALTGLDVDNQGNLIAVQAPAQQPGQPPVFGSIFQLLSDGTAFNLGTADPLLTPTSLTFIQGVTDPFSGSTSGAFVSFSAANRQFYFVNAIDRNPAQYLWNIYITDSDATGDISIGALVEQDAPQGGAGMAPFAGNVGPSRGFNAQSGVAIENVAAPGSSGQVLIGARSREINPNIDGEDRIPFPEQPVPTDIAFATLPANVETLNSGLIVESGNDLGKVLIGGTLTGEVDMGGACDFFYAGWIATGNPEGQLETSPPEFPDNFKVAGDMRSLVSRGSFGSNADGGAAPAFLTGFDLQVGGTLGTARTYDAFYGHAEVNHFNNVSTLPRNQREWEFHNASRQQGFEQFNFGPSDTNAPAAFARADGNDFMYNDTFDTAQYLGSIASGELGRAEVIRLHGNLQKSTVLQDPADYYAVSLMAGQTVTVRVRENLPLAPFNDFGDPALTAEAPAGGVFINLGIFDPDGRLIATDYNNVSAAETRQQYVRFTADRPGIYRFAVAAAGDAPGFSGGGILNPGEIEYTLTALGVGDIAIGGIVANTTVFDLSDDGPGIELFRGDFGALKSIGGSVLSETLPSYKVNVGNLRTIDGQASVVSNIDVPEGSVGLVRSSAGPITLNNSFLNPPAIGGDYQLVDAPTGGPGVDPLDLNAPPPGTLRAQLIANRGIGVIRAGSIRSGVYTVNADNIGEDGTIDLIDCRGDLVSPIITTGTGGNVGYMRVGGNVFQDPFFGGGSPNRTEFLPNEAVNITDDSGAQITFRPTGTSIANPNFDPTTGDPEDEFTLAPRMTLLTYGIRNSGGVVVVDATSSQSFTVTASSASGADRVHIGRVRVFGTGRPIVRSTTLNAGAGTGTDTGTGTVTAPIDEDALFNDGAPFTNPFVLQPDAIPTTPVDPTQPAIPAFQDLEVVLSGNVPVNVLDIFGGAFDGGTARADGRPDDRLIQAPHTGEGNGSQGSFARIRNDTPDSEIVNIQAGSVGELTSRGSIGFARSTTGMAINPATVAVNVFPFLDARNAIVIGGAPGAASIIRLAAKQGIGNISAGGTIAEIDADGSGSAPGFVNFQGIAGPIFAGGDILSVDGGAGILPSGSGNFGRAGLYAIGRIGNVRVTQGDIRGDVVSQAQILKVRVQDGSLINTDIAVISTLDGSREFAGFTGTGDSDSVNKPDYEIGSIAVQGNGGIIGTFITGADIGPVRERGGFGFINSFIGVIGANNTFHSLRATGYGIRGAQVRLGATMRDLIADGDGTSLSTAALSSQVRFSEAAASDPDVLPFDPFFGFESNRLTDIHAFLGTSSVLPEIAGVTDTGVIAATSAAGQRDLRNVSAWQIREGTILDFANSVASINVRDIINGLEITTGNIKKFQLMQDAFALTMNIAGKVKTIDIRGSLAGNSVIRTQGPSAQIDTVKVAGNLIGNINSSRAIKTVQIGGDFTGNITVNSGGTAIKTLKVGGTFIGGSLDITGNIGTIQSSGSLGSLGDTLTVRGNVNKLTVGGDLRANVRVTGNLKNITVKGSIVDGGIEDGLVIDVDGTISSLNVGGDIQQGVQVNAASIKRQKIGGQNLGEFNIVQ